MKRSGVRKLSTRGRAIGIDSSSTNAPTTPPIIEAMNEAESARAASPRWASGWPSMIVACEEADPGIPKDRKSVVEGKSGSVRVDLGGGRIIKKKTKLK